MPTAAIAITLLAVLALGLIGWGFWYVLSFLDQIMGAVDEDRF